MKRSFFQAVVVSILLYGCTTWTLTKRLEKKLDGNYTRILRATLNKSWQQHSTRHQLYGHLPPITKTIQLRRTRHAGHCWRSRDELISDVLLWTPAYGRAKAGRPARTYIQQLCEDTGCSPEDLPEAMNDRRTFCCSGTNRLLISDFGSSTQGERHTILKSLSYHTMLTTPQRSAHFEVQSQFLNSFVGPQLLKTIVGPQILNIMVGPQLQMSTSMADNLTVCLHGPKSTPK